MFSIKYVFSRLGSYVTSPFKYITVYGLQWFLCVYTVSKAGQYNIVKVATVPDKDD
jgi:hypothetical protein